MASTGFQTNYKVLVKKKPTQTFLGEDSSYLGWHIENNDNSGQLCRSLKRTVLLQELCCVKCPPNAHTAIARGFQEKCHSSQPVMRFDTQHQSIVEAMSGLEDAASLKKSSSRKVTLKTLKAYTYINTYIHTQVNKIKNKLHKQIY